MTRPELRADLRRFLATIAGSFALPDAGDLFDAGVLKSMHVIEVINHLEDTYAVVVTRKDVFAGHFRSIEAMAAFVHDRAGVR